MTSCVAHGQPWSLGGQRGARTAAAGDRARARNRRVPRSCDSTVDRMIFLRFPACRLTALAKAAQHRGLLCLGSFLFVYASLLLFLIWLPILGTVTSRRVDEA